MISHPLFRLCSPSRCVFSTDLKEWYGVTELLLMFPVGTQPSMITTFNTNSVIVRSAGLNPFLMRTFH